MKPWVKYFCFGVPIAVVLYFSYPFARAYIQFGITPLHYAIDQRNHALADLWLALGMFINEKTREGLTPLHIAAYHRDHELVKSLLNNGADVNARDNKGDGVIHSLVYAIADGDLSLVKSLLEQGADINLEDQSGNTILDRLFWINSGCLLYTAPEQIQFMSDQLIALGAKPGHSPLKGDCGQTASTSPDQNRGLTNSDSRTIAVRLRVEDLFYLGTARLKSKAPSIIVSSIEEFMREGIKGIQVEGHTDPVRLRDADVPPNDNDQDFSEARAAKVAEVIVRTLRFPPNLISVKGFGGTQPLRPNNNDDKLALNRRIEIKIRKASHVLSLEEKRASEKKNRK